MHEGGIHAQGPPEQVLTSALTNHVFEVEQGQMRVHAQSGKPYILPHDMMNQ